MHVEFNCVRYVYLMEGRCLCTLGPDKTLLELDWAPVLDCRRGLPTVACKPGRPFNAFHISANYSIIPSVAC